MTNPVGKAVKDARVAVVGGRNFNDYPLMKRVLDSYHEQYGISYVVSGGARGADTLAEQWARENEIDTHIYRAHWSLEGKQAGYRRNLRIVEVCDVVIAFPDPDSKGTYHTIGLAERFNKPAYVFKNFEAS